MAPEVQNLNDMSRTHTERKLAKIWHGGPKYNKSDMIGKGAFASVYLVTAKYDGTQYAAKEIEKRKFMKNGVLDQKVESEMRIMRRITHVSTLLRQHYKGVV